MEKAPVMLVQVIDETTTVESTAAPVAAEAPVAVAPVPTAEPVQAQTAQPNKPKKPQQPQQPKKPRELQGWHRRTKEHELKVINSGELLGILRKTCASPDIFAQVESEVYRTLGAIGYLSAGEDSKTPMLGSEVRIESYSGGEGAIYLTPKRVGRGDNKRPSARLLLRVSEHGYVKGFISSRIIVDTSKHADPV